jgi:hypothetical protein
MLMCNDTSKNKARIFYNVLQDGSPGQMKIAWNDADIKPAFYLLLDVACKAPVIASGDKNKIEQFDDDNWETVFDEFVDAVFDVNGVLTRDAFEKSVRKNYNCVFNSKKLRTMVKVTEKDFSEEESDEVSD